MRPSRRNWIRDCLHGSNREPSMSALSQKQTYALQNGMSALPPKADVCGATGDVRYGPKADIESVGQVAAFGYRWVGSEWHNRAYRCTAVRARHDPYSEQGFMRHILANLIIWDSAPRGLGQQRDNAPWCEKSR